MHKIENSISLALLFLDALYDVDQL